MLLKLTSVKFRICCIRQGNLTNKMVYNQDFRIFFKELHLGIFLLLLFFIIHPLTIYFFFFAIRENLGNLVNLNFVNLRVIKYTEAGEKVFTVIFLPLWL